MSAEDNRSAREPSASDIEQWWQQGYVAAASAYSIHDCPHPRFQIAWLWWVRGFRAGQAAEPAVSIVDARLPPGVSDPRD